MVQTGVQQHASPNLLDCQNITPTADAPSSFSQALVCAQLQSGLLWAMTDSPELSRLNLSGLSDGRQAAGVQIGQNQGAKDWWKASGPIPTAPPQFEAEPGACFKVQVSKAASCGCICSKFAKFHQVTILLT